MAVQLCGPQQTACDEDGKASRAGSEHRPIQNELVALRWDIDAIHRGQELLATRYLGCCTISWPMGARIWNSRAVMLPPREFL